MAGETMIGYLPSQLALILGHNKTDILSWIERGDLEHTVQNNRILCNSEQISKFLSKHQDLVGRIYCDDLIPFFNTARENIVEKLENILEVQAKWSDIQPVN